MANVGEKTYKMTLYMDDTVRIAETDTQAKEMVENVIEAMIKAPIILPEGKMVQEAGQKAKQEAMED